MLTNNEDRHGPSENGTGTEEQHHIERNTVKIDIRFYSAIRRWFASRPYGNVLESCEEGLDA